MADDRVNANDRYSLSDISKWAGYEDSSTVRVMNEIRKEAPKVDGAGELTKYVEFGSDDVTAKATVREQEELSPENLAWHSAPGVLHILAAGAEEAAVGAGLIGAALVVEIAITGKEIIAGDKIADARERDSMHAAMLSNLDLSPGYKTERMNELMSKYSDGMKSSAQRVGEAGLHDPGRMALVQLHADMGANAARAMVDSGSSRAAYFQQNLSSAKRYATDPAFKAGFDSIVWAKDHGAASYKEATDALQLRDARYSQAHVRVTA